MLQYFRKRNNTLLILILVVAFLLRFVHLETVPRGLHADEASFLINTVSIMETGKDEDGHTLPLILESIKDSKPALYSYLQIPFVAVFGPSDFASRLPSALLGTLSVFLGYALIRELTRRNDLSLIMAAVLALSPWHVITSRGTQEVILSFVCVQAVLIVSSRLVRDWILKQKTSSVFANIPWIQLLLFFVFSLIGMYTYHSSKILLLAFFVLLGVVVVLQSQTRKQLFLSGKRLFVLFVPLAAAFLLTASAALTRFHMVGLFSSDLPKGLIFEYTTLSTGSLPIPLLRLLYNKITFYGLLFIEQYASHFSLEFWFTNGGATARQVIPTHGLFYLVELPLLGLGLYRFIVNKKLRRLLPYWLIFLAATPLASALTTEDVPNNVRAFAMVLPLTFLVVLGIDFLRELPQKVLRMLVAIILAGGYAWGILYFLQQYFVVMPQWRPWHRSQDYAITAERIAEIENQFDQVLVTNDLRELYIYLWREGKISIEDIQEQPLARYQPRYQLGKYTFSQAHCDVEQATNSAKLTLVVTSTGCGDLTSSGLFLLEQTTFTDTTPAFHLYVPAAATVSGTLLHDLQYDLKTP